MLLVSGGKKALIKVLGNISAEIITLERSPAHRPDLLKSIGFVPSFYRTSYGLVSPASNSAVQTIVLLFSIVYRFYLKKDQKRKR